MKTLYTSLIFLAIVLLNTQFIYPQWVQTNGPGWGGPNSIAVSGTNIFAGYDSSVFFTSNNGKNWLKTNHGLTGITHSIAISGNNTFAGTDSGAFVTTDNGTNWMQINTGLKPNAVKCLKVSGNNIFAGTSRAGVFLTTNGGTIWTPVNNGITDTNIITLAVSDINIYAGTAKRGVFISTNDGTNWAQINSGLLDTTIKDISINGIYIYVLTENGLFYSTDNGSNWISTSLKATSENNHIAAWGNNIFISRNTMGLNAGGVKLSTNNGKDWNFVMQYGSISSLVVNGNNIYAGVIISPETYVSGFFISTNNGSNWTKAGMPISSNNALAANGTNIFAGSECVYVSTDNGNYWTAASSFDINSINSIVLNGTNIYASSSIFHFTGGVYLSTDNGTHWIPKGNYNTFDNHSVLSLAVSGNNIFAGTEYWYNGRPINLSTDYGASWKQLNTPLINSSVYSLIFSGTNVIAGTGNGIFYSSDTGTNWLNVNGGLTIANVRSLAVNGSNVYAGTDSGVFLSSDYGVDWKQINDGLTNTIVHSIFVSGANLFAGTDSGVYLSTNEGSNWTLVGLNNVTVLSLTGNETDIFAGTNGAGVWRRPLSDLPLPVELTSFTASEGTGGVLLKWNTATELNNSGFDVERSGNKSDWGKVGFEKGNGNSTLPINYSYVDKSVSKAGKYYYRLKQVDNSGSFKYSNVAEVEFGAPSSYALNQNYPNPFNPSTLISYRLKEKGFVKLKVYGIKGDLVKVLVNETKDAGYYESAFDGKGLASGVYICRIEVIGDGNRNVYSEIRKTVLLK